MATQAKPKTRSLTEQSAWLLAARVIGFAFSLVLPLLLVRRLNQHEFGIYKQAFLVIATASSLLPLGFAMSAYYFLAREDENGRRQAIFNILLFNCLAGLAAFLVLLFFPHSLGALFQNDEMTRNAPAIGAVIFFWLFSAFLETAAVANQEPRTATAFIILSQLTKTALLFSAAALFGTVESLIYAALIQTVLQTVVLFGYLKASFGRFWTAFSPGFFWRQAVYALPFGFAGLLWTLQTDLHNYFVSHRFTAEEFAIYAIGCFELPLIGMLSESVVSVLIPRMSELQARDAKREMIDLTARAMNKLALCYFPIYVFLMITAEAFIAALFTENYLRSAPILRINLTLLPFYIVILDSIVRAYTELGRFLLVFRIFIFAALVSLLWFGINQFDLSGMIAIVVGINLFEKVVMGIVIGRKLGVQAGDVKLLNRPMRAAAASLLAGGATLAVNLFLPTTLYLVQLVACAAVFAPVYLAAIYFFGAIAPEDKEQAVSFVQNFFKRFRFKSRNNESIEKPISAKI